MHIIVGKEAADKLNDSYVILELESFPINGELVPAFCVVPGEKIPVLEIPLLEHHKELHKNFVKAFNEKDYNFCISAHEHLIGCFGGEVDSFYTEIVNRIQDNNKDLTAS